MNVVPRTNEPEPKADVVPAFGGGKEVPLPVDDSSGLEAKGPEGVPDPNMLPPGLPDAAEAKPPLFANPANPPDAGVDALALANGLAAASDLLAKGFTAGVAALPKLDFPKAGVTEAAEPAPQGDVLIPSPIVDD